jgi:hypothetical protein
MISSNNHVINKFNHYMFHIFLLRIILVIKNPTHLLFLLQINLEIIFTLKTRNFLFNKVQITIHIITISIVLEIPFMDELVPMSKPIILLASRLQKIIHMTYDVMLKIISSTTSSSSQNHPKL